MPSVPIIETSPASDLPPIAGIWRRLAAFIVDILLLAIPAMILGMVFFEWAASLGQSGRLVGFVVALVYFGVLNSNLGSGQTLGKRLLDIRVADRSGRPLSLVRSGLRFAVLGVPFFVNGVQFNLNTAPGGLIAILATALLSVIVFGGLGAIIYLFIFNRQTRQSLHDWAVGSYVFRGAPAALPIALTTPRLHRIVISAWFALTLIVPGILTFQASQSISSETLASSTELQREILERHDLRSINFRFGETSVATVREGRTTTTFLQVSVQTSDPNADFGAISTGVARSVLERHPDLLGRDVLGVTLQRGFDFGVARGSRNYNETHTAAEWQEKLKRSPISR